MLSSLLQIFGMMPTKTTMKQDDVMKTTKSIISVLHSITLPAIKNTIKFLTDNPEHTLDSNYYTIITRTSDEDLSSAGEVLPILKRIYSGMVEIDNSSNNLLKLVDSLSDVMNDKSATVKELAVMRVVNDIGAMSDALLDILYITTTPSDTHYSPAKRKEVAQSVIDFAQAWNVYGRDYKALLSRIEKMQNGGHIIDRDIDNGKSKINQISFKRAVVLDKKIKLPLAFVNNPIYHIRMWLVDRTVMKIEALEHKKKLLELRILELKYENEGTKDPKLTKQIQYYEDKVSAIEYKLRTLE